MPFKTLRRKIFLSYSNLSLQNIITVPFLLQIFLTVGLVGYLSWRNGEQAVSNVTSKLRSEVTAGVKEHLASYLETPHLIVKLKQKSTKLEQLDVADFAATQQDFWSTIQLFDSVRAIYIGDQQGKFIYIKQEEGKFYSKEVTEVPDRRTYLLSESGQKKELSQVDIYDPRQRPWYLKTQKTTANNWSDIYTFTGGELGITAAGFLKNSQGNIQGIVGVDLILTGIGNFLRELKISDGGQVFILERNGNLVATSTNEEPFIYNQTANREQRLSATDSNNLLTKATADYLTENFSNLSAIDRPQQLDFQLEGNRQLVQVLPYQDKLGLDWLIVVVVPEADFMAEINTNTRNTIWLCLTALTIAITFGVYTSRRIAQPIARLSQVSNLIAQSARARNTGTNFYPVVKAKSVKELKVLADSFNEMVIQLKAAFKDLENTNEKLENRVKQRTKDLMVAKDAANAANRAKSEFLANMSHELRTPLHAILGFTQIALQDSELKPQQKENLITVKRSGEHLLALINNILEMSKIEAGSVSLDEKTFDLHLLLENLAKMFDLPARNKNLALLLQVSPQLPQYIKTDPVKLRQVLISLIENAIKFTDTGKVTLRVQPVMDKSFQIDRQLIIAFAVEDTGCGISRSEINSIFAPFAQHNLTSEPEGTGLGLAISQQFVHLLGGKINASSLIGRGSTFEFQIPITVADRTHLATQLSDQQFRGKINLSAMKTSSEPDVATPKSPSLEIDKSTLVSMPNEWIEKLQQAAIEVDADSILRLIEQIPSTKIHLAQGLTKMLKNFEYDEIIELTESSLVIDR